VNWEKNKYLLSSAHGGKLQAGDGKLPHSVKGKDAAEMKQAAP
jgi:hypothetical protein